MPFNITDENLKEHLSIVISHNHEYDGSYLTVQLYWDDEIISEDSIWESKHD